MLPLRKHYRVPDGKDKISHSCENTDILITPDVHATQTSDFKLKILSLNCCSLRSDTKKAMFLALVDEHNPDVIGGSESHLDQSFFTPEIFPDYYNVFRKDRTMGGGGVFLCIKKCLNVVEEPSLDTEAELIWAKITLLNRCPIHVCIFYRPPNTDSYPIEQLRLSITNLLN